MLINKDMKNDKKVTASFRVKREILEEFRKECKKNNIKQTSIIENAMKKAIEEMKGL